MARKRPGGNFGNFGKDSFAKAEKVDIGTKKYRVSPIKGSFGGSVPDAIYTSDREAAWSRWRRGWELATSNGVERPFFYKFAYEIPRDTLPIVGNRPPFLSGSLQGFVTENKEYGMHWAGKLDAGNLRFDGLRDQAGTLLAISGEIPKTDTFLGRGQDNLNFWYIQLSGTFSQLTITGVSGPVPPPLFIGIGGPQGIKPINGDILEDTIVTVSGQAIDTDTRDPATGKRYGYMQATLINLDQNKGVLQLAKRGSVQSTLDGVLVTPSRIPPEPGRFFQTGDRYSCSCQDFMRRNYAYISSLGLRKGYKFAKSKVATVKPGRYEEMVRRNERGKILVAAQQKIFNDALDNKEMLINYPSGEGPFGGFRFAPTQAVLPTGLLPKNSKDPNAMYRDLPAVFADFGGQYRRGFGDKLEPSGVAEGMPKYGDYKKILDVEGKPTDRIKEISDYWTYTLDEYRYCKHIYAMRYADGEFPNEPSDYPVQAGSIAKWEDKLVTDTEKSQRKAFERLVYYGLGYMDTPPFNLQSPMMGPMVTKLINIPQPLILMQNFNMIDQEGNTYNVATSGKPAVTPQPSGFTIADWDFRVNYVI
ncbi:MAG TPA: hypothetical protein DCW74_07965 [Alteromonas australica]|uniref:Uncharacterized protein n=1 Tax=Alteromonas australica TaxID=589873 RepID=A0A350P2Y7_9ALTE|nr:hypothetical protein [Alteromonas australica]